MIVLRVITVLVLTRVYVPPRYSSSRAQAHVRTESSKVSQVHPQTALRNRRVGLVVGTEEPERAIACAPCACMRGVVTVQVELFLWTAYVWKKDNASQLI